MIHRAIIKIAAFAAIILSATSCVSMQQYRQVRQEMLSIKHNNDNLQSSLNDQQSRYDQLAEQYSQLQSDYEMLKQECEEQNDDSRIAELEEMIAERDQILQEVREALVEAVGHLEGKGLTLQNKDGKVYVMMEDKLLFETGKYDLTSEGRKAIRDISKALSNITTVDIMIEGHTDNKGFLERDNAQIIDNWDLSCKRATQVVRELLKTKELNPQRITATGRGQYQPVATNGTEEGRSQNRRTEIVLTPQLDRLMEILN